MGTTTDAGLIEELNLVYIQMGRMLLIG
jgi:hypothetical protein